MSSNGVPIQEISGTVGHKSTHVTETVYRHVIVPAIRGGATVMDDVFGHPEDERKRFFFLTKLGSWLGAYLERWPGKSVELRGLNP